MRPITLVLPHFCNLGMLAEQLRVWADYPQAIRDQLHVVVVDDCSPEGQSPTRAMVDTHGLASLRLYRLLEKKRWNWLSCRNLGAEVATTDWLLMTDMDHVIPAATFERIMAGSLNTFDAYRFTRVSATRRWPYDVATLPFHKPHNDTWLLTRSLFLHDRVGGYDERLAGCYGTSSEFSDRLRKTARACVTLSEAIVRYPREIIPDASTSPHVYTRKGDPINQQDLKRRKEERALIENWQPLRLTVPWEQIV